MDHASHAGFIYDKNPKIKIKAIRMVSRTELFNFRFPMNALYLFLTLPDPWTLHQTFGSKMYQYY